MKQPALHEIIDFARRHLPGAETATPLQKDLSRRTYFAVKSGDGRQVVVCTHADAGDPAIDDFVEVSEWIRAAGVHAPAVIDVDRERGWVLQSYAGAADVWSVDAESRATADEAVLQSIVQLQQCPAPATVAARSFDEAKLGFEVDLFLERYEQAQRRLALPELSLEVKLFLQRVTALLAAPGPRVFVHRDLHSRNVLLDSGRIALIDFQDARMGLPWYDLASYLYDPYLDRGFEERQRLRRAFQKLGCLAESNLYYLQAFQRTVKAMGTYLGVLADDESPFYRDALRSAFRYLEEIAQLGGFPDHIYLLARRGLEVLQKTVGSSEW